MVVALSVLSLAACASTGTPVGSPNGTTAADPTESKTLTVVTHESFDLSDEAKARFAKESGYEVSYIAPGDAGTVVNQLILTKDSPLGDVVYGIDNTFAQRAIDEGVLGKYDSAALPAAVKAEYPLGDSGVLTPVDYGQVCVNADNAWFAERQLAIPATLDDLLKPEYKGTLVVENPASSSPGLSFLFATVGAKGANGYLAYWEALKANGVKVVSGWTEAYTVEFSGSSGKGKYPLVVSYNTSPADEIGEDGQAWTSALTQTCFQQTEYAGVINGAQNEVGAQKFIEFLLSVEVQSEIPDKMWMYPVHPGADIPEAWATYAPQADKPLEIPAADMAANREAWIKAWTEKVIG
jgi:thiamine transport system substrate-binding protein